MANIQNYSVTSEGAATVTVPSFEITGTVDEGGTVIADYTGENALHFPQVLATLTTDQQNEIVGGIAATVLLMKAGLY